MFTAKIHRNSDINRSMFALRLRKGGFYWKDMKKKRGVALLPLELLEYHHLNQHSIVKYSRTRTKNKVHNNGILIMVRQLSCWKLYHGYFRTTLMRNTIYFVYFQRIKRRRQTRFKERASKSVFIRSSESFDIK